VNEQQFLDRIIHLATVQRWAIHHDRPARRAGARWATAIQGHAGFPDLVLARQGVVLFREVKGYQASGRLGRLSSEQLDWARQLDHWATRSIIDVGSGLSAIEARRTMLFDVWTPDDWDTLIVPTLTARAARSA
jgi:hypothetical protein